MSKRLTGWTILAACAVFLSVGSANAAERPAANDVAWNLCIETARQLEEEYGIPDHLLSALTLTETGRRGPNRQLASWPWTVHDGKRGYHLNTKEEAVTLVRKLREGGRRSVDVGCMQVNLKHHPRAFTSIEEGFEPAVNIRYAAEFLSRLYKAQGNWEEAAARYHSYNPQYYKIYAAKVMGHWKREKRRAAKNAPATQTASLAPSALDKAAALVSDAIAKPRRAPNRSDEATFELSTEDTTPAEAKKPAVGDTASLAPEKKTGGSDDMGAFFERTFGRSR